MAVTRQAAIAIALQEQAMMPLQASGEEGASAPHRIQADLMTYRDAWQELFVDDQVMAELSSEAKDGALVWLITLDGFWGEPSSFNRGESHTRV